MRAPLYLVALAAVLGLAGAATAKNAPPNVVLTKDGEKLEAEYINLLTALRAKASNALPPLPEQEKAALRKTREAVKAAQRQGAKGIVLRQGDWIYFPKHGWLGYTAPEPERPFGLAYARMGFTNSDIDEHGQIKPGAPPEQLYNLATDLRQSTNLALKVPDRVRAMRTRFLELAGPAAKKAPGEMD